MKGYIAIFTVIIITAIALVLATTIVFVSIGELQASFALSQGEDTLQFVDGCVEDALWKSRINSAYNGGTITRPEGTCSVTVDSKVGNTWTLTITTTATNYTRTMRVVFNRDVTGITLTSWKEV